MAASGLRVQPKHIPNDGCLANGCQASTFMPARQWSKWAAISAVALGFVTFLAVVELPTSVTSSSRNLAHVRDADLRQVRP